MAKTWGLWGTRADFADKKTLGGSAQSVFCLLILDFMNENTTAELGFKPSGFRGHNFACIGYFGQL